MQAKEAAIILFDAAAKIRALDTPIAVKVTMRERFSEIASTQSMDQVTNMTDSDKERMREILSNNLAEGKGMRDTARDLQKEFPDDIDSKRAEMIARTETTRVKNIGNHEKYQEKGFQSFTVDYTGEACPDCVAEYEGKVFSMDDTDMLPPLHPQCMCVSIYHQETPEELADRDGLEVYNAEEQPTENTPEEKPTDEGIPQFSEQDITQYLNEDAIKFINDFADSRGGAKIEYGHAFNSNTGESVSGEIRGSKNHITNLGQYNQNQYAKEGADIIIHNHPAGTNLSAPSPGDLACSLEGNIKQGVVSSERGFYYYQAPEEGGGAWRMEMELRGDGIKAQSELVDEIKLGNFKPGTDKALMDEVNNRYEKALFKRLKEYGFTIFKF